MLWHLCDANHYVKRFIKLIYKFRIHIKSVRFRAFCVHIIWLHKDAALHKEAGFDFEKEVRQHENETEILDIDSYQKDIVYSRNTETEM